MATPSIEDLRKVIALSELPDEHLQWILDHSEYKEYKDGELIVKYGDPADAMWLVVEGKIEFFMNVNGKLVPYFTFANDKTTGGAGGLLPYSRMKIIPGNSYASGTVRSFYLHKQHFPELEQLNPELIQRLVGYMTERARHFATERLQQEKVSALGQLAAGIAHELNNPAAAINRIAADLNSRLTLNYDNTRNLLALHVEPAWMNGLLRLVNQKESAPKKKLTALQRMEHEDTITEWFRQQGYKPGGHVIEALTEAGFEVKEVESLHAYAGKEAFLPTLEWLENLLTSRRLMKDLDEASCRISNLVGAIKSHVQMDRTHDLQPTNVHNDIDNTLTLLGYKLRNKNISIKKEYCSDLRPVPAYVGELNQVWTNLIDNAIYAMDKNGMLNIRTRCDEKEVNVHITDNGSGIPADIISRIYDPFFTTKKTGDGTGIGLDLVNRIVKRHKGVIQVHSEPGRTEFTVCIPYAAKAEEAAS